ncbi:MAG: DinB family protein [Chloroflexota bacterium]
MYNVHQDLINALRATPDTLTALLTGVSQEEARSAKGGDEGWSVAEVLCHLRDTEEFSIQRVTLMRDQENPDLIPFDQEQLAVTRNYTAEDMHAALFAFIRSRQQYVAILEALPTESWERPGNHLEAGQITIFSYVLHIAAHDAVHCAQIARQLSE